MEQIIPSKVQLSEEIIEAAIGHRRALYLEMAELKQREKELKELLKDHSDNIADLMREQELDEIELDGVTIKSIKSTTYQRLIGIKAMREKHSFLLETYPELLTDVNVKAYLRISLT